MKLSALSRRSLLGLLAASPLAARGGAAQASRPTSRPAVLLVSTRINGEYYYEAGDSLPTLAEGAPLVLRREPANQHDRRAIEVLDSAGRKLGYVPRIDNSALAQLIDTGERLRVSVTALDIEQREIRIAIEWLPG